jgi:hypothetical protein
MWSLLLVAPAGAQVPLVVGSVRDQHGAPIVGATIATKTSSGVVATSTDTSGTFALHASDARTLSITCRYCRPATVAVQAGQPVVAIVRRYDALVSTAPSPNDLANLPYTHVESAIALQPFTLLAQTSSVFPGSQLSDRGLQPANALVIDANVPDYDVVLGTSPYATIPAMYEQTANVANPANAFLYGDQAGSGIVSLDPFGGDNAGVALVGDNALFRAQAGSDAASVALASFSNDDESRQRGDAQFAIPLSSAQTLLVSGGTSQGRFYESPYSAGAQSFSFAQVAWDDAQPSIDTHASFVTDLGTYDADDDLISDLWTDSAFTIGMRTRGAVQAFADLSARYSTGIYDAQALNTPRIAGSIEQDRLDAGLEAVGTGYDVTGGVGLFGIDYAGGSLGVSSPSTAHLATPSLQAQLFPQSKWSLDLDASGAFTLPDLWQQYSYDDNYEALTLDRQRLYTATLGYTDDARVRVSLEAASQRVSGYANGLVTSAGVAVAWQIAPLVALQAWTMHVDDATSTSGQAPPYGIEGIAPTVNAVWLTYDNGFRVDAIYRRDLLNGQPFSHLDGDVSAPISGSLRWYAGSEDWQGRRTVDVGVRIGK